MSFNEHDPLENYKSKLLIAARRKILQHVPVGDFNMEPEKFFMKYKNYFFPLTPDYLLELCQKDPMIWHWMTGVGLEEIRLEELRTKAIDAIEYVLDMDVCEDAPRILAAKLTASKMLLDLSKITDRPKETMVHQILPTSVKKRSLSELEDKKRLIEERIAAREESKRINEKSKENGE